MNFPKPSCLVAIVAKQRSLSARGKFSTVTVTQSEQAGGSGATVVVFSASSIVAGVGAPFVWQPMIDTSTQTKEKIRIVASVGRAVISYSLHLLGLIRLRCPTEVRRSAPVLATFSF